MVEVEYWGRDDEGMIVYQYTGPGDRRTTWPKEWWWMPVQAPVMGAEQEVAALGFSRRDMYNIMHDYHLQKDKAIDAILAKAPEMSRASASDLLKRFQRK